MGAPLRCEGAEQARQLPQPAGGINVNGVKYAVKLVYDDEQSNPDLSAKEAADIISQKGAEFLLGPYGASNWATAAAVADRQHVPMISANGSESSIFNKGYGESFGGALPISLPSLPSGVTTPGLPTKRKGMWRLRSRCRVKALIPRPRPR